MHILVNLKISLHRIRYITIQWVTHINQIIFLIISMQQNAVLQIAPHGAFISAWQRLNGLALHLLSVAYCCCSFHLSAEKEHLINKPSLLACAYLRKSENIVPWNRSHRRSTGRTHKPNHFPYHIHATKRSAPNRTT